VHKTRYSRHERAQKSQLGNMKGTMGRCHTLPGRRQWRPVYCAHEGQNRRTIIQLPSERAEQKEFNTVALGKGRTEGV